MGQARPNFDDLDFDALETDETGAPQSFDDDGGFSFEENFNDEAPIVSEPTAGGGFSGPDLYDDDRSGDQTVPRISIHAFCEKSTTASLIQTAAGDRRLAKASVSVDSGGLSAAIDYFSDKSTPNLLIVESLSPGRQLLADLDRLAECCDENVKVLVIGAANDVMLYRQLVARGVSEYLVPPFQPVQLIRSISTLYVDPDKPFVGRSVAVIGAKGGIGASTIAHNLAWSISENIEINTTLVDLDLSFGTTALDFNQDGNQTIADALLAPDRVDDVVLDRLLTRATDRLSLFTAPATLNDTYDVDTDAYEEVIERVRRTVPFVVLDMPHIWSDWAQNVAINADEVVVVCGPDLASLRNGKNLIDHLKAARPNDAEPKLVLNMVGVPKRPEIPVKDFAGAIGAEPVLVLPFDPHLFGTATNNGQMLAEAAADSKCAMGIDHLAMQLTGKEIEVKPQSLVSKLLGRK